MHATMLYRIFYEIKKKERRMMIISVTKKRMMIILYFCDTGHPNRKHPTNIGDHVKEPVT